MSDQAHTLTLTLRQPAQVGDKARKNYLLSTMDHIPGSVIRGALSARWLAENGVSKPGTPQRDEFLALFEGGVRYGPLLLPGTEFMSLAVVGHRYDSPDCETADYDQAKDEKDAPLYCGTCETPLEQRRGLTAVSHGKRPKTSRRTSVAINDQGVAKRGALFTRETLDSNQAFSGTITATDDSLLKILADLGPVRIGGRRTTHGLADITITPSATPVNIDSRKDGDLILRLRSPGIFTDAQGRPSKEPSKEELEEVLDVPAVVVNRWTRWEEAGGWHAASGLPKPQELTVTAGSTYIVHAERPVGSRELHALARRGIGLRRHEGFGDLAPPPTLRPGSGVRRAEEDERRRRLDTTRPLIRLLLSPRTGDEILARMRSHATGEAQAKAGLDPVATKHPEPDIRAAMTLFLGLPPREAADVLASLEKGLGR